MTESIDATSGDLIVESLPAEESSWWKSATADWRETAMAGAVALQVVHIAYNFFQASFAYFCTQMSVLGGLFLGGYYVNVAKYLQSFEQSAKQLEVNNRALQEKLQRLETAASTLVATIARFDTDTADYLASMTHHKSELGDSVGRLNHAVDAFARVFEDHTLGQLWRETLEAVKAFQEAKAEYDQIRIAIAVERAALDNLHADLQTAQKALSLHLNALGTSEEQLSQLYQKYLDFLQEILNQRRIYEPSEQRPTALSTPRSS